MITPYLSLDHDRSLAEASFLTAWEYAPIGIKQVSPEGRFLRVNRWICDLLGYCKDELLTKTSRDITHPEDLSADEATVQRLLDREIDCYRLEKRYVRKDGSPVWIDLTGSAVRSDQGELLCRIGVILDLTGQKAKDFFLASLSHELRTPLTPVSLVLEELARQTDLPPRVREQVLIARRGVRLETRLLDDLLDLTRITHGKLDLHRESLDFHPLIDLVLESYFSSEFEARKLGLVVEKHAADHQVLGDPARLQQVIWNLLRNAIKFTPEGGVVRVRTSNPWAGHFRLEVIDSGIGMDDDFLLRLFTAYEQGRAGAKFGGLGLGLVIAKAIVEGHGGTIAARSDGIDRGSTFVVELSTLPVAGQESGRRAAEPASIARKRLDILLIEDHTDTARVLSGLLGKEHRVRVAQTVAEAKALSEQHRFDLVISDLALPDGTGLEFLSWLRERQAVPGIALSGFGTEQDVRRSLEAGFVDHLTKPVDLKRLQAILSRF